MAEHDKREALRRLIRTQKVQNALIFCNRKRDVDILYKSLTRHKFDVGALHGDMAQTVRFATLEKFKANELRLLVCSDVAARGLDIGGLSHVFNFDVPIHAEDYVHRIGRTGRAGLEGHAFTIAMPDDRAAVEAIEKLIGHPIPPMMVEGLDPVDWVGGRRTQAAWPRRPHRSARKTAAASAGTAVKGPRARKPSAPASAGKTHAGEAGAAAARGESRRSRQAARAAPSRSRAPTRAALAASAATPRAAPARRRSGSGACKASATKCRHSCCCAREPGRSRRSRKRRARHERRPGSPQEPFHRLPVGRRAAPRSAVDRGGTRDPRRRARILPGEAVPARDRSEPPRKVPSRDHERDGRDGLPRRHAGGLRLRRRELRQLRTDRARGGARRFRLPFGVLRAVVAGDVSDLGLRFRGAEGEIPAETAQRRMGRLLRPDRTRRRLRSRLDAHPRARRSMAATC